MHVRVTMLSGTANELVSRGYLSRSDARGLQAALRRQACKILRSMGLHQPTLELSILLVPDPVMREMNARFRGLDRVTNVLSFPQLDSDGVEALRGAGESGSPESPPVLLGDVVLAPVTVGRRAGIHKKRRGMKPLFFSELNRTLIHGIVHLCGYSHKKPGPRRRMRELEAAVLDKTKSNPQKSRS